MNLKKPTFWDFPKPNFISFILLPLTIPLIVRNFFVKFFFKKKSFQIKTICIGNIYIGGTGKTPLTIKIYELLKKFDTKIATVKKFYANQLDEQRLLSKKTSTIISKTREKAIFEGIRSNYNTLIFDDGLQDSRIEYDLKFVCFKSKNWIGNGQLIPSGPMRENISSLKRFDAVFLNGNSKDFDDVNKQIKEINPRIKIFHTLYKIYNLKEYDLSLNYLIFSGIGNPSNFKEILINNNFNIAQEIIFPDHYNYQSKDLIKIIKQADFKKLKILTTEKDYMKIPENFKKEINCIIIDLIIDNEDELIKLIVANEKN